ncbi:MAG: hypothetical protein J7497_06820, partial [Chitinophagaceae bacterium]|nr:hypothetical protein [Chitinophagaceae bacterium]
MQLTAAFLLVFSLSLSAKLSSQTITYSGKDVPLSKVFSVVEKQTGFVIMGLDESLSSAEKVTIDANKMELPAFMKLLFSNTD